MNHTGADGSFHSGPGGILGCRECDRDRAEAVSATMPDSGGIDAIMTARRALGDGTVPVPDCNLVTAAMEVLSGADADRRPERLALAGGLIALLLDEREAGRA